MFSTAHDLLIRQVPHDVRLRARTMYAQPTPSSQHVLMCLARNVNDLVNHNHVHTLNIVQAQIQPHSQNMSIFRQLRAVGAD